MDSLINHYTANKKVRNDDAYSPGGRIGLRPDRATLPYCQRAREAYPGVPVIAGGVEASLRRLAHYDYWSDTVKRSILLDSKADLVVFGMGEQAIIEMARRLDGGETVKDLRDMRGVAYAMGAKEEAPTDAIVLPSYEEVKTDKKRFALATKIIHTETNPLNARRLVQYHDRQAVVCNPPALPISQEDMDRIYGLPYTRKPHPMYREPIPAHRGDQGFGDDHAGVFRGVHVLFDHGAPGADHSVAVAGVGAGGAEADRAGPGVQGGGFGHRGADGEHVSDALHAAGGGGEVQAVVVCASDDLQAAGDGSWADCGVDEGEPAGGGGAEGAGGLGRADGPGAAVAGVHGGAGGAPCGRAFEGGAGAYGSGSLEADEEAGDQRLQVV